MVQSVTPTTELDADAVLARRVARGDEGALEEVYDRLGGIVYGLAVRSLGDPELAEECMQDVFASVWRTAARFDRSRGSLGTWVVALARNRIVDAARARARRPLPGGEAADGVAAADDDPAAALERVDRAERVARAMASLPPNQLDVIRLSYFHGLTQREIAVRLQIPLGTVKSRMRLGLDRLAELLAEEGLP
jgi:RNA polymerase sigma-70 factor (ECF subfamily)